MYIPVFWKDRIVEFPRRGLVNDLGAGVKEWSPKYGETIQKGTQQSATNFGNMDYGVLESALAFGLISINLRLLQDDVDNTKGFFQEVDLTNSLKYPASNAEKTVTLPKMVNNTDYTVQAEVVSADGPVERVEVYGKALNAYKVCYYGSAKKAKIRLLVRGGIK